jgi:hypothetical protein
MLRRVSESPRGGTAPAEVDSYLLAWADLRRRRAWAWISLLAWVPVGGGLSALAHWALGRVLPFDPGFLVALPLMGVLIWLSIRADAFRCPRCNNPFFHRTLMHNGWSRHCLNCGIKIGTPQSIGQDIERQIADTEWMRRRLGLHVPVFVVAVVVFLVGFNLWLHRHVQIDRCLDQGGRWVNGACER